MLKLMANFQVFQTIYHVNFCISTDIKTTANFLNTDIEMASFIARDCMLPKNFKLLDSSDPNCKIPMNPNDISTDTSVR